MTTNTMTASSKHIAGEVTSPVSGGAAVNSKVSNRVERLRTLAETDLRTAQDEAWDWLIKLGAHPFVAEAQHDLLTLLDLGTPADADGRSDGVLLRWVDDNDLGIIGRLLFPIVKGYVATFGSPWLGKKYDRANGCGTNSLTPAARFLTKLIAPGYQLHKNGDVYEGFEMYTRVEKSVLVPGSDVLVLDFQPEELGNPWLVNTIHDEVVEIVPGVYLGTKTLQLNGSYQQVAWWATRNFVEA